MTTPPLPSDEAVRLLELAHYHILDTAPEEAYDRITRLAARLLDVPVAILNFVDQGRHWGKATTGLASYEIPRADSPCAWTILQDHPLMVPDLQLDERFQELPAVQGGTRMYAGTSLRTVQGQPIGTLCVADTRPRALNEIDLQVLQDLAAMAMSELELRRSTRELAQQVDDQQRLMMNLQRDLAHSQTLEAITAFGEVSGTPEEITAQAAELLGQAIAADWTGLITVQGGQVKVRQVHSRPGAPAGVSGLAQDINRSRNSVTVDSASRGHSTYIDRYAEHPQALPSAVELGVQAGAWIPLGSWAGTSAMLVVLRIGDSPRQASWREGDRALLEAAGRSVRAAVVRCELLAAATQASRQDTLTGIANRRALEEDLAALDPTQPLTLALMDLDGFKALNDTAGHAEGDKALRVFAKALQAEFAEEGKVYRLGGDEFVLTLPEVWAEAKLLEHTDLAALALCQLVTFPLGVSVGSVTTMEGIQAELLGLADTRMYEAKRRRKASQHL